MLLPGSPARFASPSRLWLPLTLGALLWTPVRALAQTPEARAGLTSAEACPLEPVERPLAPMTAQDESTYEAQRRAAVYARRRCILALREERDRPRRAARGKRRFGLTLGYDGALLFHGIDDGLGGRFRAPSAQLGAVFRRHYRARLGLHALLAVGVGNGRIAAGPFYDIKSRRVGASLGAVAETGVLIGPGNPSGLYAVVTSQLRLTVPGKTRVQYVFESELEFEEDGDVQHVVKWRRPTTGLGIRAGFGWMFGDLHQGFIEVGGGGGALLDPQRGGFITVTARAGWLFGS